MIDEKQQPNLESLSHAWSERVKTIRQMAKKGGADGAAAEFMKTPLQDHAPAVRDEELFSGTVYQDFSVQDIFVGDSDFYHTMDTGHSEVIVPQPIKPAGRKTASLIPRVLTVCLILAAVGVLLYEVLLNWPSIRPFRQAAAVEAQPTVPVAVAVQQEQPETTLPLVPEQPVSLVSARASYQNAEFAQAYNIYKRLVGNLPETAEADITRDFLRLNMALCLKNTKREDQASDLLKTVAQSSSPVVRVLANYHLCLYERDRKQYLAARSRAYQVIGLLDVMNFDAAWSQRLRQNCYFLAGECITREALSLGDADQGLPPKLWPEFDGCELPFADLDEEGLEPILNAGALQLSKALLGPKIQEDRNDETSYWTVNCNKASIGELVSRFSANSGYDVRWGMDSDKMGIRDRSVSLYMTAVHDRQFMTVATGCVGLLASFDEARGVTIYNPMEYASVSDQIRILTAEAVSCWQRYLPAFREEHFHANAYYLIGMLKAQQGLMSESLAAYKMVPGSYSHSPLGPGALTSSAALKINLHDYPGAYADLKEAVEQYPAHDDIERTYLTLAEVSSRMGRGEEATKLYCKVYYLNSSMQSQASAALAAGKILYQDGHYTDAELWLNRYLDLAEDKTDQNLYQGCMYLGKTWLALGNDKSACEALCAALSGKLTQQDYVETVRALVQGYMHQNRFGEAFGVLSEADSRQLSLADSVQMLLLKSKALRGMGLADKAANLLIVREETVLDDLLKAQIGYELSDCYIEQGDYHLAYKKLAQILEGSDSGPEAHKIALRLAQVCLTLELDDQALSVGSELLSLEPAEPIGQRTLEVLAAVYQKQKNYDRAAMVLMGHWQ
jgi:tetratricopeptide (TPR) repeat protein